MNNSTDDVTKALKTLGLNSTTGLLGQYLFWASNVERIIGPAFPSVVFRGHALGDWELLPTLCRKPTVRGLGKADAEAGARYVDQCEMVIKMRFREQFELNGWTDLEVLALAQHYKAPTTLLDWTANPLSGLWFAVDDARYDDKEGAVIRLTIFGEKSSDAVCFALSLTDTDHKCGHRIHVFECPQKVDRSQRQRSLFSRACSEEYFTPLNNVGTAGSLIQSFRVPASEKGDLRRLLVILGLDPFTVYGDRDSFGKAIDNSFELPIPPTPKG